MTWWESVVLGLVQGLTEFLPVSSTGHLTIVEKLLGLQVDAPEVTAFTAVIQIGSPPHHCGSRSDFGFMERKYSPVVGSNM